MNNPATTKEAPTICGIKGFDANLKCRDFQFEVGKTYRAKGKIVLCKNGFHAIPEDQHPLSVFNYYPPAGSRFCIVNVSGETAGAEDKIAAEILTVEREISVGDLALEAVRWVMARSKPEGPTASGYQGAATASGYRGAATASGDYGAATASGYRGAATASGTQGAATASGTRGAATASGDHGAATASGDQGAAAASGDQGAATASGYRGAATASGDYGAAAASGYRGAATASGYHGAATASGTRGAATASGDYGAATASGTQGAATASGYLGKVSGAEGNALFAVEREAWNGPIVSVACGVVGVGGIKPDTHYRCIGGKLVEA